MSFDVYVDDHLALAIGDARVVEYRLVAARDMQLVVEDELKLRLAPGKGAIVASSDVIATRISRRLRWTAGRAEQATINLGIDYAPDRERDRAAKAGKLAARFRCLMARRGRAARFIKTRGANNKRLIASSELV